MTFVEGSPQIRLQHDAQVVVALVAQPAIEGERAIGGGRVLHVDAHEPLARGGVDDDGLEVLVAEIRVQLEAERGELDRDVRVELLFVQPREHVAVLTGDRTRLVRVRNLLTQHVDGRELALRVQSPDDADGVVECRAGDVARRESLDDGLRNSRQQPDDRAVEESHERAGW